MMRFASPHALRISVPHRVEQRDELVTRLSDADGRAKALAGDLVWAGECCIVSHSTVVVIVAREDYGWVDGAEQEGRC